jgi:hypothetical protein
VIIRGINLGYSAHDRRVSRHASELRKHPQDARFGLVWPAPFG